MDDLKVPIIRKESMPMKNIFIMLCLAMCFALPARADNLLTEMLIMDCAELPGKIALPECGSMREHEDWSASAGELYVPKETANVTAPDSEGRVLIATSRVYPYLEVGWRRLYLIK